MPYLATSDFLARMNVQGAEPGDPIYTAADDAIKAASDEIDGYTNRSFEQTERGADDPALFRPLGPGCRSIDIGDVVSVTKVETRPNHETAWAELPADRWAVGETGKRWPAYEIWTLPGTPTWPWAAPPVSTVRVEGVFGWPTVPEAIKQACRFWAYAIMRVKALPLIPASTDDFVPEMPDDTTRLYMQARTLLRPYRILGAR